MSFFLFKTLHSLFNFKPLFSDRRTFLPPFPNVTVPLLQAHYPMQGDYSPVLQVNVVSVEALYLVGADLGRSGRG